MSPMVLIGIALAAIVIIIAVVVATKKESPTADTASVIAATPAITVDNVTAPDNSVSTVISTPTTSSVVSPVIPTPSSPAAAAEVVNSCVGCLGTGRYIIIDRVGPSLDTSGDRNAVSFGDIKVTNPEGDSVLGTAKATSGSTWSSNFPASNILDDKPTTITHTAPSASRTDYSKSWVKIDLGVDKRISTIVLTNRSDGYKNRAVGINIKIISSDLNIVYTSPTIADVKDTYTFSGRS